MRSAKEEEKPRTIGVPTFVLHEVAVLARLHEGLLKVILK
jgi:hypothetical protein